MCRSRLSPGSVGNLFHTFAIYPTMGGQSMKRFLSLTLCLVMVTAAGTAMAATESTPTDVSELHFAVQGEGTVLTSATSSQSLLLREAAGPDTFDLYGGERNLVRDPDGVPGSGDEYVEGKFEDPLGVSPRGLSPNPGDWTGVDLTDTPNFFQVSTFNAENLNGNGASNNAMWSGLEAGIPATVGWSNPPGYGNNWNDVLLYRSAPLADPTVGQTVNLDFFFNYDTEAGFDFVNVEYDSSGTWTSIYQQSGTNKDTTTGVFPSPGVQFANVATGSIVYAGNDYAGPNGDEIRIRIRFESDGAFSDEDGDFVGNGAMQVDDITVTSSLGTEFEDFEGGAPYLWNPDKSPFAGNFAAVFARITDIDPCAENLTPMVGFIDFGQEPDNGPGVNGLASTGGTTSDNWAYGIPGGFVYNYNGGLTLGEVNMNNEVWSPEFDWDLPGTADDGADVSGSAYSFTVWRHNPLSNGIFYVWHVRSQVGGIWGEWVDRNFVYFSATGEYLPTANNTTDLIPQGAEKVQVALGSTDLATNFAFPGADATPAPLFDDVRFYKYRIGGISFATRAIDLANDGFPVSGEISAADQASRDLLDVPFDMARDISSGDLNVPGDSVIFDASAVIAGTAIQDLRMKWALRLNPTFENAIRTAPARAKDENVVTGTIVNGSEVWTGDSLADSAVGSAGTVSEETFFVDLPDEDFMYPGDVLHYYIEATDSDGRVTTLPGNIDGFGQWDPNGQSDYSRTYTVRALPSITSPAGDQPSVLVYNDFGRRGGENDFVSAFSQLGLLEGRDWDSYTTQGPSSGVSNGIGSAGVNNSLGDRRGHGATADQLAGYSTIVYLSGNLNTQLISDGSNTGQNDKSPDLLVMTSWKNLTGQRNTVYFGDFIGSALLNDSPSEGGVYLQTVMGIAVNGTDVRPDIGGQTAPVVQPTGDVAGFNTEFIAFGGCFGINTFDNIAPVGAGSARSHGFVDPGSGTLFPGIAAGVVFDRVSGIDRKVDITFPFGFLYLFDNVSRAVPGVSSRTLLLEEILAYLGENPGIPGDATAAPSARKAELSVAPNPFNPKTTVSFALPKAGMEAKVKVFNVRGELVKTLHDGVAQTADLNLEWNGRDDRGASVASGVYLVKAITEGFSDTKKAVLVK